MKRAFVISLCLMTVILENCLCQDTREEHNYLFLGYGIAHFDAPYHRLNYKSMSSAGPFCLQYRRTISKGAEFGVSTLFTHYQGQIDSSYSHGLSNFKMWGYAVNLRVTIIKVLSVEYFAPYFAFGLGFADYVWHSDGTYRWEDDHDYPIIKTTGELVVGFHVMPVNHLGFYGEFGLNQSIFQTGAVVKF